MDLERAKEITWACVQTHLFSMGVDDVVPPEPPGLRKYSLEELLEANRLVCEENQRKSHQPVPHGIQVYCEPRLVAAIYVAEHYEASPAADPEPVITVGGKALFVVKLPAQTCRKCRCTDDRACPGGCFWVEEDLCSACAGYEGD